MADYLIVGAGGQLGREFHRILEKIGEDYIALKREELDVKDFNKILETLRTLKPKVVINCSAYNQVDKAEEEFEESLKVNTLGVANLCIACREVKAKLVHYSTDYVFDGKKEKPYNEEDRPNPLNKYGLTKYLGEKQIELLLDDYLIFRTSWVYGEGKQNFLYKLEQWAKERDCLKIACDEFSVPTSTRIIVETTLKALRKGLTGLFHLVNSGYASRYEWAKEYCRIKGIKKLIYPAYQADFNLPAKRPKWSVMSNERIIKELEIEIPDWKEELQRMIEEKVV